MHNTSDTIQAESVQPEGLAEQVLHLLPEALVVIDEDQNIVHVNPQAEEVFQTKASELLHQSLDIILPPETAANHRRYVQHFVQSQETVRLLQDRQVLSAYRKNGERFSFLGTITKLHLPEGFRLAVIIKEVTEFIQSERARRRVQRALQTLSQCQSAVIRAEEETALLEEVCRIAVDTGGYLFAWIGYAEADEERTICPMAQAGQDTGYLQEVHVSWADNCFGQSPTGRAIRTGQIQFTRAVSEDPRFAPWKDSALQRGFQTVAAFPLRLEGQVIGSLNLYHRQDTFDQEEIELLSNLADNLSFGIQSLRTQARYEENNVLLHHNTEKLRERVKELNLYTTMGRLKSQDHLSLSDILQQVVEALPSAWRFPELAAARITVQGCGQFQTAAYQSGPLSLAHSILLGGQTIGEVQVVYPHTPPTRDSDPFLDEEYGLIESVAHHVAEIVHHSRTVAERRKLSSALEQTADAVMITDKQGRIEYVNSAFETLTGFARQEALGHKPSILKSGQHPKEFYRTMWQTILKGDVYRDTLINRTKDGSLYYEYKTITPLHDQQGRLTHFLATGKDLTEQLQAESRLKYLSTHDAVTGLVNQSEFIRQVDQTTEGLSAQDTSMTVVVLGLDNFKAVNELLGRSHGDWILKMLGQRLSRATSGLVGRLGGDEFCICLHGQAVSQIGSLVESYLSELAKPFVLEGEEVALTATAGISSYPLDGRDGLSLVQKAETAMARAKETGLYRFEFFTADMQVNTLERLRRTKALVEALEHNQFRLVFQPQFDTKSKQISGAEALVRWQPPNSKPISPLEFIPVLEEMGRINELGDFVLQAACSTFQRIRAAGLVLPRMAINVAAPQLEEADFVRKVMQALGSADMDPACLELEVTESLLISHYEGVQDRLQELQNLGVGVALDDFGTGYSSLQYLTRYPFSKLKIDKSFVWNMEAGDKDYEVVKAIISLGHSLGISVLAEGIETKTHVQALDSLGCEYLQGYLYSQPLDEEAFLAYLQKLETSSGS